MYDGWTDGWDIIVNGIDYGSKGYDEKTYNLPKSLLLAEHKLGIKTFNFKKHADVRTFSKHREAAKYNGKADRGRHGPLPYTCQQLNILFGKA